jgi:hypothetical protein
MSLVRLLQANGVPCCYHELRPDLHQEGIDYYEQRIDAQTAAARMRKTRAGVFFEANNRLFSLAGPIQYAFPEAKFVHLFRDGRDVVRSGLERGWYQPQDRFACLRLGAGTVGSPFVKICRYWAEVNQRIASNLRALGCDYLPLRFEEFVRGQGLDRLEDFLQIRLSHVRTPLQTNGTSSWSVPSYDGWCTEWQRQFEEICGAVMKLLGYGAPTDRDGSEKGESVFPPRRAASGLVF